MKSHMKKRTKLASDERGLVSMIVTILIMMFLSLIVLAMSQGANREQRQSLDRQLSDQAFYNAESGINDTVNWLYNNPTSNIEKKNCDPITTGVNPPDPRIDGASGVNKYTCVMYNKAPETIEYNDLDTTDSKLVMLEPLKPDGTPTNIESLTISWDDASGDNTVSGCNFSGGATTLPTILPPNCNVGGVRAELISPQSNRSSIAQYTYSAYLLPRSGSGSSLALGPLYPDNQGIISPANCQVVAGSRTCKITISNISAPKALLHLRSLYKKTDVSICGSETGNCTTQPVRFKNSQVMIDVTGKSNDVLRRVQVRVPAKPQYRKAEFGIFSSADLCKVLDVSGAPDNKVTLAGGKPASCEIN